MNCLLCNKKITFQLTLKEIFSFREIITPVVCTQCKERFVCWGDRGCTGCGKENPEKGIWIYLPFWSCHRGLLALLLQGTAGRPGQRGCSHRQAQHRRDDCFFLAGISRAFIEESWFGTGFDRSRDICDADPIVRHVFTYNYQFGKCCGCGAAFLGNICRLQCVLWLPLP